MKIDRLLGIVMYLLNRDIVSGRTLAKQFEVSPRTIQRDIEAITLAGIPIVSIQGSSGGYGIMENYKLNSCIMHAEDYFYILSSLKGLWSAYENKAIESIIEKIKSLSPDSVNDINAPAVITDFGILKEQSNVKDYVPLIEMAAKKFRTIEFEYINANNEKTQRTVEPLAVLFKWHAWYLFGYCQSKKNYRLFRISRMRKLSMTETGFTIKHNAVEALLQQHQREDMRNYLNIKLFCSPEIRVTIEDYFSTGKIIEAESGNFFLEIRLPDNEMFWFGLLLGLGNKVKVLEPQSLREKVLAKGKEIIEQYS